MTPTDVTLFGATGFVGRITARHLAEQSPPGLRVALAGRSLPRLEALRRELGPVAASWDLVTASTDDPEQIQAMVASTRVVASTVGPYARFGAPVVQACASLGTDYCDLTGEVLFVRDTIRDCHDAALASGARIVHACGFDSIPSDLGVLVTAERAAADGHGGLTRVRLAVRSMRGGFSGGTVDSMRSQVDSVRADPSARAAIHDPQVLSSIGVPAIVPVPVRRFPPGQRRSRLRLPIHRNPETGRWTGPFVMGGFNARIVRRSNALLGGGYGPGFRYTEVTDFGTGPTAPLVAFVSTAALTAVGSGLAWGPSRAVLDRLLPSPGEGPSERVQNTGHFVMVITARTSGTAVYQTVVSADKDPGYGATAVMLGQSALCLALDRDRLPARAGVLTPATAMGTVLVDRLRAQGMVFDCKQVAGDDVPVLEGER